MPKFSDFFDSSETKSSHVFNTVKLKIFILVKDFFFLIHMWNFLNTNPFLVWICMHNPTEIMKFFFFFACHLVSSAQFLLHTYFFLNKISSKIEYIF